jgi:hypothetical protein
MVRSNFSHRVCFKQIIGLYTQGASVSLDEFAAAASV